MTGGVTLTYDNFFRPQSQRVNGAGERAAFVAC